MSASGKVHTVLGPIEPQALGITLAHEHLLITQRESRFVEPREASKRAFAHRPFTAELRADVLQDFNLNLDNIVLDDPALIVSELAPFRRSGGKTIVDLSSLGIGRDPEGLREISAESGVQVVMGCGYYIDKTHPVELADRDEESLAEEMEREIFDGVGDTGIRAGIIGEIGCEGPTENELKVLRAAALAQSRTGAAINVHTPYFFTGRDAGLRVAEVLRSAGADLSRVIFSHQDGSGVDLEYQELLLSQGIVLEYDCFGFEVSTRAYGGIDYPKDITRIRELMTLIDRGWMDQVLLSGDMCFKLALRKFGGWGYAHLLENVIPRMRREGVSQEVIEILFVRNPRRLLTLS